MAEGLILLPATAHNAKFEAFVASGAFDRASRTEMLDPAYFVNLSRLEKEYVDFVQKRKRFWQEGFDGAYVNKTAGFMEGANELTVSQDPFTYAARLKGEEADAATAKAMKSTNLF